MNTRGVKRSVVMLALLGAGGVLPAAFAAPPTTAPSGAPSVFPPDAPARAWFQQLDSTDPRERDSAIENLMGLQRDQLPALRALIVAFKPLSAARLAPLHDIVVDIYLTGDPYLCDAGGFMGLRWLDAYFGNNDPRYDSVQNSDTFPFPNYFILSEGGFLGLRWPDTNFVDDEAPRLGVPVNVRLPGFPCFRMLRDGDMIEGVLIDPSVPITRLPNMMTATKEIMTRKIRDVPPGRVIDLMVLRSGERVRVPVKLALRPFLPRQTVDEVNGFFDGRMNKAEAYWNATFAPVCKADSLVD